MGLKHFHILFIIASILLCVFFGLWAYNMYAQRETAGYLLTAIASLGVALALLGYSIFFMRKVHA